MFLYIIHLFNVDLQPLPVTGNILRMKQAKLEERDKKKKKGALYQKPNSSLLFVIIFLILSKQTTLNPIPHADAC